MVNVELGFLEQCESWRLESRLFPSKVGGKPAWLSLKPLPTSDELTCEKCHKIMIFLCQIYAPYHSDDEQSNNNFHRSIFLFICRNSGCNEYGSARNLKVFRSSLAVQNDFYPADPPDEKADAAFDISKWSDLCNLCGIYAAKKCSQCKRAAYCCKDHQVLDWRNGHKLSCSGNMHDLLKPVPAFKLLFPEWELVIEPEELDPESVDESQAMNEYQTLLAQGKTGTLDTLVSELDLNAHATSETDKVFAKFKKRINSYPDQVVRYSRGGEPLLIAKEPPPSEVPDCEYCGTPRQFEFQIMPQMLAELKELDLDWGVLLVYTCRNSCAGNSINCYKKEYVFKQDVSDKNN